MARVKKHRILIWAIAVILLVAGIGAVLAFSRVRLPAHGDEIPLAEVKRGEIDLKAHATGELRASHSIMLTAPAVGGDSLQITRLLRTGQSVKKGDIVFEFDPSEQLYKLEQNRSELLQAEQEITKAQADAAVLGAVDKVVLLKDRYGVRRAELDVQKNELVSKIDADKNDLALQQAKRVLAEQESRTRPPVRPPLIWQKRNTTRPSWAWTRRSRTWIKCTSPRPWMDWSRSRKT
jgi:multidrug efflux pump subunit AcrA (membrane-fusion protein)